MTKWLRYELKQANKEKKRCKKTYSDWVDDEFNCGPNKFIFGVISDDNKYLDAPQNGIASFCTLNELQIYYNRDTQKYILDMDLFIRDKESYEEHLSRLLLEFEKFVNPYGVVNTNLFNYLSDMDNYWIADDLKTLYYKFYIFVVGYKQLCENKTQADRKNLEVKG